jgi:predicted nucleotidyltransferase
VLEEFIEAARAAFGEDLSSIVLYGSAAEGKLRSTSDVNVVVSLAKFDPGRAGNLRAPVRNAQSAIQLRAMFILDSELPAAVEAFAVKFSDIARRRRVLYGKDPFSNISPSREAEINRLKQTLLNTALRLREAYISRGLREEQLARVIADAAGPIRASAAALLELEGAPVPSPKEALERVAANLPPPDATSWGETISRLSEVRQNGVLDPGVAGPTLVSLTELLAAMRSRVDSLKR